MSAVESLNLQDPVAVARALREGARANLEAHCRDGSIDAIGPHAQLIATGDVHDNPLHLARLAEVAELPLSLAGQPAARPGEVKQELCSHDVGPHITLHELIHSDRLIDGLDFSYKMLTRVAALKAFAPERVHVLLANHELSQIIGAGVVKNGVRCTEAFDAALDHTFAAQAPDVRAAVAMFIRSMPIALRCRTTTGDILCAHSLPSPAMMQRFDTTILSRPLTERDYQPQDGSAHMMVWGRGHDAELLEDLVERWGVNLFILGHEFCPHGIKVIDPNAILLNSDHDHGVYLPLDLDHPFPANQAPLHAKRLEQ